MIRRHRWDTSFFGIGSEVMSRIAAPMGGGGNPGIGNGITAIEGLLENVSITR